MQMHKPFLLCLIGIAAVSGCSSVNEATDAVNESSSSWSLVHKQTIQQGNVLSQKQLDLVQVGMSKEEIRQELGTPSLVDVFHQERWDYVYTQGIGSTPSEKKQLALFFEEDRLARLRKSEIKQ